MKKIKMLTMILAFSLGIIGSFAFNSKDHAKKFNVEAFLKASSGLCNIDKGSVNCDTPVTDTPCTIPMVTGTLYNSSCTPLYKQD